MLDAPGGVVRCRFFYRDPPFAVHPSPHAKDVEILRSPGGRYVDVRAAWVLRTQGIGVHHDDAIELESLGLLG